MLKETKKKHLGTGVTLFSNRKNGVEPGRLSDARRAAAASCTLHGLCVWCLCNERSPHSQHQEALLPLSPVTAEPWLHLHQEVQLQA